MAHIGITREIFMYIRSSRGVMKGDTRSLDYGSYSFGGPPTL